jgi:hypothetical protein
VRLCHGCRGSIFSDVAQRRAHMQRKVMGLSPHEYTKLRYVLAVGSVSTRARDWCEVMQIAKTHTERKGGFSPHGYPFSNRQFRWKGGRRTGQRERMSPFTYFRFRTVNIARSFHVSWPIEIPPRPFHVMVLLYMRLGMLCLHQGVHSLVVQ